MSLSLAQFSLSIVVHCRVFCRTSGIVSTEGYDSLQCVFTIFLLPMWSKTASAVDENASQSPEGSGCNLKIPDLFYNQLAFSVSRTQ